MKFGAKGEVSYRTREVRHGPWGPPSWTVSECTCVRVKRTEPLPRVPAAQPDPHITLGATSFLPTPFLYREASPCPSRSSPTRLEVRTHLLHQMHIPSPELAGGLPEDDAGELPHHLDLIFFPRHGARGLPQASSSSPSTSRMNSARSTLTPLYTNLRPSPELCSSPMSYSSSQSIPHCPRIRVLDLHRALHGVFTIDDLKLLNPSACHIYMLEWALDILRKP
jgi:hypothetical protein